MEKWIDSTAAIIEAGRAQGSAPTTLPARDLATALNLMNERALFASFTDEQPSMRRTDFVDTLGPHLGDQHLRRSSVAPSHPDANMCSCPGIDGRLGHHPAR